MINRKLLLVLFTAAMAYSTYSQTLPLNSPYAEVTQRIGITDVTITYHRPSVNGREIWGKVVPYGYTGPKISPDNLQLVDREAPWRAGANGSSTLEFSDDVEVENQAIAKGKYALFIAPFEDGTADIILSSPYNQNGSFVYYKENDVVRFKVNMEDATFQEQMVFEFSEVNQSSATVSLAWENKKIPFSIKVNTSELVTQKLVEESYSPQSMTRSWRFGAMVYLMNNKLLLDKAESWAQWLTTFPGAGFAQFTSYANILKLNGNDEASNEALDSAYTFQPRQGILTFYGNQTISLDLPDFAVRNYNYMLENFENVEWTAYNGLATAYSMKGDFKKAKEHLKNAKNFAPDGFDESVYNERMKKLQKSIAIN